MAEFKMTGTRDVLGRLKKLSDRFPARAAAALYVEGEMVMTRSKRDFVPVDLGVLRNSGFVEKPVVEDKDVHVTLGYGGAASAYALAVHETPSGFDPPSWQGTKVNFKPAGRGPKYLERPLLDSVNGMAQRLAVRLKVEKL